MSTIYCPHCGSADVRKSYKRPSGWFSATYRCKQCKRHFKLQASRAARYMAVGLGVIVLALIGLGVAELMRPHALLDAAAHHEGVAATALDAELVRAKQGDPAAQFKAGIAYWSKGDYQQAFPWIKAAADGGHGEAQYYLGMAYLYGRGVIQNYRFALENFEAAANLNNHEAQYILGVMYRDGLGQESSHELAYSWLNIAAARGHEAAAIEREKLAASMTSSELARAQEISLNKLTEMTEANAPAKSPAGSQAD